VRRWEARREGRHARLCDEAGGTVGWVYDASLQGLLEAVPVLDHALDRLTLTGCEPSLEERLVPAWGKGKATYAPDGVKYVPIIAAREVVASIRTTDATKVCRVAHVREILTRVAADERTSEHHRNIALEALGGL